MLFSLFNINIICSPISFSPKDIAGQLTIIQAGLLANLSTGELMDKNWEDSIKSPGLKEIANIFNRVSIIRIL